MSRVRVSSPALKTPNRQWFGVWRGLYPSKGYGELRGLYTFCTPFCSLAHCWPIFRVWRRPRPVVSAGSPSFEPKRVGRPPDGDPNFSLVSIAIKTFEPIV